jgi:hypothetical protein
MKSGENEIGTVATRSASYIYTIIHRAITSSVSDFLIEVAVVADSRTSKDATNVSVI